MALDDSTSIRLRAPIENDVPPPDLPFEIHKREAILAACGSQDKEALISLADKPGGFLEDNLRSSAWPLLLGFSSAECEKSEHGDKWQKLAPHKDEEQVQKDVDRSFIYYPKDESEQELAVRKRQLYNLIVRVLREYPELHYFQGYHDIAQVFLLALGEDAAFHALARVSLFRIRDYMLPTIKPAEKHLRLIPAILKTADPVLANHISETPPFFALPATLTMYAHEIQDYSDIARLFDFILAHEPVLTIYLFASLVILRRCELLEIPKEDHDMLLFTLQKLPQPLDVDGLIRKSLVLYKQFHPTRISGWTWISISSYSVLKTSIDTADPRSLDIAREMFDKQMKQHHRDEVASRAILYIVRRRRPIVSISATIFVGLLSFWLRRSGNDTVIWLSFWRVVDLTRKAWHTLQ